MITQSVLPVVSYTGVILGWVTLDAPHLFTGSETTYVVATKSVTIQHYSNPRVNDRKQIEYMGVAVTRAQVQQNNWKGLPAFTEASAGTPYPTWFATGSATVSPEQQLQTSALKQLRESPNFTSPVTETSSSVKNSSNE